MPLPESPALEFGHRAIERAVTVVLAPAGADESIGRRQYFLDVFGIVGPVCGDVQRAARLEPVSAEVEKKRLQDTPLVVPLFWPGVGKIDIDSSQGGRRKLLLQHIDRVFGNKAQIHDAGIPRGDQAVPQARFVNLNAEIVEAGIFGRLLYQRLAIAETYFEHDRCATFEQCFEIEHSRREFDAVSRPKLVECAPLRWCQAARAANEASNWPTRSRWVLIGHDQSL